jgi:hypothetical protein
MAVAGACSKLGRDVGVVFMQAVDVAAHAHIFVVLRPSNLQPYLWVME